MMGPSALAGLSSGLCCTAQHSPLLVTLCCKTNPQRQRATQAAHAQCLLVPFEGWGLAHWPGPGPRVHVATVPEGSLAGGVLAATLAQVVATVRFLWLWDCGFGCSPGLLGCTVRCSPAGLLGAPSTTWQDGTTVSVMPPCAPLSPSSLHYKPVTVPTHACGEGATKGRAPWMWVMGPPQHVSATPFRFLTTRGSESHSPGRGSLPRRPTWPPCLPGLSLDCPPLLLWQKHLACVSLQNVEVREAEPSSPPGEVDPPSVGAEAAAPPFRTFGPSRENKEATAPSPSWVGGAPTDGSTPGGGPCLLLKLPCAWTQTEHSLGHRRS